VRETREVRGGQRRTHKRELPLGFGDVIVGVVDVVREEEAGGGQGKVDCVEVLWVIA
jgi:hypothetical protein